MTFPWQAPTLSMLIGTFSLPPAAVALEHTLHEIPEIQVEAERIAAHSTKWTMPCLWAANAEFDAVDEALTDDPTVDAIVETYEFDDEKYYQLDWAEHIEERIDSYLDKQASILDASASAEGWRVRIRFVNRDQFDAFRDVLHERDITFQLRQLTEPGSPRQTFGDLTPDQRDALVTARKRGYYRVPREITARELAEELDISHQSVSELLRRGTESLIDATLVTEVAGPERDT